MDNAPYIAIADDDPDDQELLAEHILKGYPWISILFFKDGREIIEYLQTASSFNLPALVILDYKMPIYNGAEVLKFLESDGRFNDIKKIIWSTSGNIRYVNECLQNGAEKYFTKPTSIREMDHIVQQIYAILDLVPA